jgi:uncharacterized membrane protein YphA (DoxX/SURF4 family)
MKYAVWFVRLVFAAWMIPAGIEHFIHIFPQPMGSTPLSEEMILALLNSHLFDIVKGVEFIAGAMLMLGYYPALGLVICMPVSFNVFYWDAPLSGWTSSASRAGDTCLLVTVLLCLAYIKSYRSMFTLFAKPRTSIGAPGAPTTAQTAGA